jgi:hypothetical protein
MNRASTTANKQPRNAPRSATPVVRELSFHVELPAADAESFRTYRQPDKPHSCRDAMAAEHVFFRSEGAYVNRSPKRDPRVIPVKMGTSPREGSGPP